jgi:hypothetical protein
MSKEKIYEIDLHGIRHKEAIEAVKNKLQELSLSGSFSLTIITGNSSKLQSLVINEILLNSEFNYYIPSWNLGQIIVDYVSL